MYARILFNTFLLTLLLQSGLHAQGRFSSTINSNWLFTKGDTAQKAVGSVWQTVSIPHTWNTQDVLDDEPGYYRGDGWYKKTLYIPAGWKDREVYLYFEGAGQSADVFVNGKSVGKHQGGYTFFSVPISSALRFAQSGNATNDVVVRVNNSVNENLPPIMGDYNIFGGLYRDVYLNVLDKVHFDADNQATSGIFITTPQVNAASAVVQVKGSFVNGTGSSRNLIVSHRILTAEGAVLAEQKKTVKANAGQKVDFVQDFKDIKGQRLWSPDDPYLYRVVSRITDAATGQKLDEVSNPLGFRWYAFSASEGFSLNGNSLKLIGTSRHQDYPGMGNALPDAMHVRDVELLKEMGGNFLRVAHYPQDPAVLQACDRLGILASVETPVMGFTDSEAFASSAKQQHREIIRQTYNHPSVIIWSYMNEMLLRVPFATDSTKQQAYFRHLTDLARELEAMARQEDPARYTLIPNHGAFDLYNKVGLTKIPRLVGWNLYQGWYGGTLEDFGKFLDMHHRELPDKPVLITEFGADADNRIHSFSPIRFDKSVEYTMLFHQAYLKAILDRPFVAAGMIWNLTEFNTAVRAETLPNINPKGIMTYDRKEKDPYRFYKANLLKAPYIQIGSKEWNRRVGTAESESQLTCSQPVVVFSNQPTVTLTVQGKVLGTAETKQGMARFTVPFVNGLNRLVATVSGSTVVSDQADIMFRVLPPTLKNPQLPFDELNVSLGDSRFFFDEKTGQNWLPEQVYKPGSWGYVGGKQYVMKNNSRVSFGSGRNILGTELDPIYQTQRTGIEQFKFDVPTGDYELVLHFAELISKTVNNDIAFNLGQRAVPEVYIERSFDVLINGQEVISGLSNSDVLKTDQPVATKFMVSVQNQEGITVSFNVRQGETVLNGIQLKKIR
ncbi:glycoside hydrolase family 2 TIM barrel-domain containing protein [Spirosoma linguale]|uniref:Beta-galactosidase n=1 Tax=Spirosoma linguale (strain ATCC 33905 / DSM 74 / LMG 10896 / Claus 1) TaxID=504472 RepID=D2QG81_SPILD|nr:Beta-galactosidase [Spirosoma linguale DSM 74]